MYANVLQGSICMQVSSRVKRMIPRNQREGRIFKISVRIMTFLVSNQRIGDSLRD